MTDSGPLRETKGGRTGKRLIGLVELAVPRGGSRTASLNRRFYGTFGPCNFGKSVLYTTHRASVCSDLAIVSTFAGPPLYLPAERRRDV